MYETGINYCTETGLNHLAVLINRIKEYEGSFDLNEFLKNIEGIKEYFNAINTKYDATRETDINKIRLFQRVGNALTMYGYLSEFMIDKAEQLVNSFDEVEKLCFNKSMNAFVQEYGDLQAAFIWMTRQTMVAAGEDMSENMEDIAKKVIASTLSWCKRIETESKDKESDKDEIIKSQVDVVKNMFNLMGAYYANCFINPEVADLILNDLNPGIRNNAIELMVKHAQQHQVKVRKAKKNSDFSKTTTTTSSDNDATVIKASNNEESNTTAGYLDITEEVSPPQDELKEWKQDRNFGLNGKQN